MKPTLLLTVCVMLLTIGTARAEVDVKPLAVVVGSPAIAEMDFSFQPNGIQAGTRVHLLIEGFESPVVKLEDDNCKLDKAVDSTGKDLLEEKKQEQSGGFGSFSFGNSTIGPFPKISEDGKRMLIELIAPQAPAKGADSVQFEGSLAVLIAEGTKTVSAKDVAADPGQVQLGEHSIEIMGISPSDWEEGKFKLEVKMTTKLLDLIASWKITDAGGAELSDGPNSTMTMMGTAQLELTLEKKPTSLNIELELYDGMKQVEVPIDLQVGLGIE